MKPLIDVRIADEEQEELARGGEQLGRQLSRLLDDEMIRFNTWATKTLGGPFTKFEMAAVKTYLYQKLVGRIDNLETKPIDILDEVVAKTG